VNILVGEDPGIAGFIAAGLRELGHIVDIGHTRAELCAHGRARRYDVIIFATALPRGNAKEILAGVRATGQTGKVLLLTPGHEEARTLLPEFNADGYLAKPFRFAALLECLARLAPLPSGTRVPRSEP